jgi:allantoate deiminase
LTTGGASRYGAGRITDFRFRIAELMADIDVSPAAAAAATVLARADRLAACTEEAGRLTRRFATPALVQAGDLVLGWMREAGMRAGRDAIGNVVGRWEPPGGATAGTVLLGSHLDTVRDAGRYDGMLGVLVALAAVERLHDAVPFAIEVYGFADEEGVRYGTAYLGSSVVAGAFDPAALERRDVDGVAMADAISAFGGDPALLADARRDPAGLLGYVEVHIEQGPVLEAEDLPVGVVTGIAGQTRAEVVFDGEAGHAGTVPMALRRDALVAAAEWIGTVEAEARAVDGLVATVGAVAVEPGASNVIPARASLTLDVRHLDDATRETACADLRARAEAIAARRGTAIAWTDVQATPAVACGRALTAELEAAVADAGVRVRRLPSGAGHDAAVMSRLCEVAMLFVRCAGGISHNPAEAVSAADVAVAIDVTSRLLDRLADAR